MAHDGDLQHNGHLQHDPFPEDPRYAQCARELWVAAAYWLAHGVVTIGVAWAIGGGRSAEQLRLTLGFPSWFFWSGIVVALAFSLVPVWLVRRWFVDVPIDAEDGTG